MRRVAPLVLALLCGCGERPVGLRVGVKDFAEQAILGEMLVQLLRADGRAAVTLIRCHDTYGCHHDLNERTIDLMVEYSGTGLSFIGDGDGDQSMARVRARYAPLGLTWLEPLGFDNGYRLLVAPGRAAALGLQTIADLDKLEDGVRVACPPEYLRRPRDGLASLAERYGLRVAGQPLLLREPGERFQALLEGRADVAVGYATDGAIASLGLRPLEDPLGFFPPYQAAVLVRTALLRREPGLRKVLGRLEGRIDTSAMRGLNYQVQVEGRPPGPVAARFLRARKLVSARTPASRGAPRLAIAVHRLDRLDRLVTRAIQAVRVVFPGRPVVAVPSADPAGDVAAARAQLAVLGAERFFQGRGDSPPRREERLEAVTALGSRLVHLIRRNGHNPGEPVDALSGRVGVGPAGSGGARVTEGLLAAANLAPAAHADTEGLLSRVAAGKLDAALVLAAPGEPALAQALARLKLRLYPLPRRREAGALLAVSSEQAVRQPFLRPARIPAGTYAGQPGPLETLGSQVVLAGPPPSGGDRLAAGGGPAAALPSHGRSLSMEEVEQLADAARSREAPDPALPSAWTVRGGRRPDAQAQDRTPVADTLLNLVGIAFLVWLASLIWRRRDA